MAFMPFFWVHLAKFLPIHTRRLSGFIATFSNCLQENNGNILAPAGHYIGISFDIFFLEENNDFVSVYDGPEIDESKLIAK